MRDIQGGGTLAEVQGVKEKQHKYEPGMVYPPDFRSPAAVNTVRGNNVSLLLPALAIFPFQGCGDHKTKTKTDQ